MAAKMNLELRSEALWHRHRIWRSANPLGTNREFQDTLTKAEKRFLKEFFANKGVGKAVTWH